MPRRTGGHLLALLCVLHTVLSVVLAEDVVSCGGFVKISSTLAQKTDAKLDYSRLTVLLTSADGTVRFESKIMPTGYYIIPVYDTAKYFIQLRGPEGWRFVPESVPVSITNNLCNGGHDINFELTGFRLSGSIATTESCQKGMPPGANTIKVELLQGASVIASTTVNSDGNFAFNDVAPGRYTVRVSHHTWSFLKDTAEVELSWGNAEIKEPFVLSGFDISGAVRERTAEGEPVKDVDFVLYSKDANVKINCEAPTDTSEDSEFGRALCVSRSNTQGEFSLANIPCGQYTLVPIYRSAHYATVFDVVPASLNIKVKSGGVRIEQPFLVKGFSVTGRVVNPAGQGVPGVTVSLRDTTISAVTNAEGQYKLEQVTSGTYTVEARKEHYVFPALANVRISPSVMQLPDIKASKMDICGRVYVPHPPSGVDPSKMSLVLKSSGPDVTTRVDGSGNFCIAVAPGKYLLAVQLTEQHKKAGLIIAQPEININVENEPALNILFTQSLFTVSGRVRCISACDPSISVVLRGEGDAVTTGLALHPADASGEVADYFVFKSILPGKYEVSIKMDSWCWEQSMFNVEVKSSDVTNIEFVQTGYRMTVRSSHAIDLLYSQPGDEPQRVSLPAGDKTFCLPKPGLYELKPVSCYQFEKEVFTFSTDQPQVVEFKAKSFRVFGKIEATKDSSISIIVKDRANPSKTQTLPAKLTSSDAANGKYTLEYVYWATLGESITLQPQSSDGDLFFYPSELTAGVETSSCPPELPLIQARPGMYLEGQVTPPIEGVVIQVLAEGTDAPVLKRTTTDKDGRYRAGPLPDDKKYTVTAEADNYYVKPVGDGNFRAQKLASIRVSVETTDKQPLPGVLVSLSGSEGYRSNQPTGADGTIHFTKLFPGLYYLQPILIEYTFDPPNAQLEIEEGREIEVKIKATRVAYSAYGSVLALNGQPEKFVHITAKHEGGGVLETQTDEHGKFRLRGLQPHQTYTIAISTTKDNRIDRASPANITVEAKEADIYNLNFILFRKVPGYDLFGRVETDRSVLGSLTVQLVDEEDPDKPVVREAKLGPADFFDFPNLPKQRYTLRLKTTLQPDLYDFKLKDIKLVLNDTTTKVSIPFTAVYKDFAQEAPQSSFIGLMFFVLLGVGIYYNKKLQKIFNKYWPYDTSKSFPRLQSFLRKYQKPRGRSKK